MLFKKPLFGIKVDLDGFNPDPVLSPFVNINHVPNNLNNLSNKLIPFILFFIKQLKWPMLAFTILFTASSILTAMLPFFISNIVSVFENLSAGDEIWPQLKPAVYAFIFWMIFMDTASYHISLIFRSHIVVGFKSMIFNQLQMFVRNHSLSYFQNDFAGRLTNKISDTAEAIEELSIFISMGLVFGMCQFLVGLSLTLYIDITYFLLIAAFLIVYVFILVKLVPKIVNASTSTQNSKTVAIGQSVDEITNISSIKLFARQNNERCRLLGFLNDFHRKGRYRHNLFWKMYIYFDILMKILWISFFSLLSWSVYNGYNSFSDAVLLVPVVISVSMTIWWFSDIFTQIFEKIGTIKDGIQTLIKPFDLVDREGAQDLELTKANIILDNVTFKYPGQSVFDSLNLDIPAAQKIGLVGPSGAGKTTLVQLLLRLHDIQNGSIQIDGQNIAEVTQNSLREHIAVIPQHTDLLHRSIRENIAYGNPEASDAQIIEAAKRAHAHDFIQNLVDHEGNTGYEAMVGERGVKLSGGQRQRIAIARAILKDAPILLLDEATSALDSESERLIQESLTELMEGRTVIAIAHRLSTISKLDRLLVMEDGRIIEDGTHHELIKNKGLYARLWGLQSGGFIGLE